MSNIRSVSLFAILTLATSVGSPQALGSSGTWNLNGGGDWGTSGNWSPAVVPGSAAGDVIGLNNDISVNTTVTSTVDRTFGILNMGDTTNTFAINATAGRLIFNNNGSAAQINVTDVNSRANGITGNIRLTAGGLNIFNAATTAASSLNLNGTISTLASSGTQVVSLNSANGNGSTISALVSDGGLGGQVGLLFNSSALTILSNAGNTFSGGTVIQRGGVRVLSNGSLGTGMLTLGNGSTGSTGLSIIATNLSISNGLTVSSGATGGVTTVSLSAFAANATFTVNGPVILQRALQLYNNAGGVMAVNISGDITGAGSFYLDPTSSIGRSIEFTLSGSNSFSGGITNATGGISLRLNLNSSTALGATASSLTLVGSGSKLLDNTSGAPVTIVNNNAINLSSDIEFIGSNALNLGTGAVTINANRAITVTSSTLAIGGVAETGGARTLTKLGAGVLALNGANTYTGTTTISAGTLLINGNSSASTGAVNVNSGVLGGSGTVGGAVTVNSGGTLSPGNSPGILTVANDVTLANGGALSVELNGSTVGTGYDQLVLTGISSDFSLTGTNNLVLSLGFVPAVDQLFFLTDNQGGSVIAGVFEQLNGITTLLTQGSTFTFGGQDFKISYTGDYGSGIFEGAGNDLVLSAIPEPGAATFVFAGAGLFLLLRRRRINS